MRADEAADATVPRARARQVILALLVSVLVLLPMEVLAQGEATSSPGISSSPTWEPIDITPLRQEATLVPSAQSDDGIPLDATFTLSSTSDRPATTLAEGLSVDPPIDLRMEISDDLASVVLDPVLPLEPGMQLRFTLHGEDGSLLGSWVYRTRAPLQVTGTLPTDRATGVRTDTGIEITFDRDGVLRPARHFRIDPPVEGRFELHDRVLAFIPTEPLEPSTIYEVTLEAGVRVRGSDARLEQPVRFAFQTRPPRGGQRQRVWFVDRVAEVSPRARPILEVIVSGRRRDETEVEIYRYPSFDAAIGAVRQLQGGPSWADWTPVALPTGGLELVGTVEADLRRLDPYDPSDRSLTLPERLPRGWYLVVIPDGPWPAQLILQVTDLAAYAHVTWTDSLLWVNSLASRGPVSGARVSIADGPSLGRTDAEGVLVVSTSEDLKGSDPAPIILVRAEEGTLIMPFRTAPGWLSGDLERGDAPLDPADRFWTFFYTDREAYRTTDSMDVWGMLRAREDDSVPATVELRLVPEDDSYWETTWRDDTQQSPAIVAAEVSPAPTGVFSGTLAYEQLPLGSYIIEAWADGRRVGREWVSVQHIVKPSYRLEVATERRAYLNGEPITLSASASFFEGTQVPAAPLAVVSGGTYRFRVTDSQGRAEATIPARSHRSADQITIQPIRVRPRRAEEGEISASTQVAVLASSRYLSGTATLARGTVRLTGGVDAVDLERVEQQMADGQVWRLDPRGAPVPGARVTARITELVSVRRRIGTRYDYIGKRVIPVYEYRVRRVDAGTRAITAGADGRFSLEVAGRPGSGYLIGLTTTDEQGRTARTQVYAERPYRVDLGTRPYLARAGSRDIDPHAVASVGDRLAIELRQGQRPQPVGGDDRYLFMVQQVGLRRAEVQRSPVFALTFREVDAPMLELGAVRFTGSSFVAVPDGFSIRLEPDDRRLSIELTPDQARYEPGDEVRLDVRTTDADGDAATSSVVLTAVDEKLYEMGLAETTSALEDLYRPIWSGTLRTYASHQLPIGGPRGEGGDAAGGGERADFRDVVLFRQVETDADGRATLAFDVSDDLTSWRVSATAVSMELGAGEASLLVPVGLPFFVELVSQPEYLVGDEVRLRARAYGAALEPGDPVTLTVSAPTLGLEPRRIAGSASQTVEIELPELVEGRHAITVDAVASAPDGAELQDSLRRSIDVVPSRLERAVGAYAPLVAGAQVVGGRGLTRVVISDAGRGRFYPELVELASRSGPRADQALAAIEARHLLATWFDGADEGLPAPAFDATQFQRPDGSMSLLPYSSGSEELSFLVSLAAPDAVDHQSLAEWFRSSRWRRSTQERALRGLAARAALGEDVLRELDAVDAEGSLTTLERLLLAIGYSEAGDLERALDLERELLRDHGQQLGSSIRLWDAGTGEEAPTVDARERSILLTALLAILAADLGDDATALAADAYVRDEPLERTLALLQRVAVVRRLIERTEAAAASFRWELEGEAGVIVLGPGESHRQSLTAAQRASIRFEPLSGSLGLASSWDEPLDSSELPQDRGILVERTVQPEGVIRASDLVEVTIRVDLGPGAVTGCYLVTDHAPSGLAPVRDAASWPRRRSERPDATVPLSIAGQQVTFCAYRDEDEPVRTLRYQARLVSPGTYRWEPTLVQSTQAPQLLRLGDASELRLGKPARGAGDVENPD